MCSIGRNSESAIGSSSGATLGGSLLTGAGNVANGRAGSTLLVPSVSGGAGGTAPKSGGGGVVAPLPTKRPLGPQIPQ
jgi:hypothetical protein